MVLLIAGLILVGIGIGLLFAKKGQDKKALNMKFVQTSSVGTVLENAKHITGELGAGNYTEIVELKGKVVCRHPLEAEFSKTPCVYYSVKVEREYETEEVTTNEKEGSSTSTVVRKFETVSSNKRANPFYLEDQTGRILVDMEGKTPEAIKTHNRYEEDAPTGISISFGKGSKTLGYRYTEYCLPVNQQLYVLGEANDRNGDLRVSKPLNDEDSFIVSTKSEDQLVKAAESSSQGLYYGGIALVIIGAGVAIYGVVSLPG